MVTVVGTCSRPPVSGKLRMVQSTLNEPPAKTIFPLLSTRWRRLPLLLSISWNASLSAAVPMQLPTKEERCDGGAPLSTYAKGGRPWLFETNRGRVRPGMPNERKTDVMSSAATVDILNATSAAVRWSRGGGGSGKGSGNGG
jgi:hypothetical protein